MMRQEVNLYLSEFIPKRVWLPFNHSVIVLLLFVVILFAYYVKINQEVSLLTKENERLLLIYGDIEESSEEGLIEKMVSKKNHLEMQISSLSSDVKRKKKIKRIYEANGNAGFASFYDVFSSISKYSDSDISISEIAVYGGGQELILSGMARSKERIPNYLKRLKEESVLKMTSFGLLAINQIKNSQHYQFEMSREVDVD